MANNKNRNRRSRNSPSRKNLPPGKRGDNQASRQEVTFTETYYEGELPPPEIFSKYDPEFQKWMLDKVAKEQDKRHEWAMKEQENRHSYNLSRLSAGRWIAHGAQICGTTISLAGLLLGGFLLYHDKSTEGFVALGTGVGFMILSAIWGKSGSTSTDSDT